jgi:hypothetical protein
MEITKYTKLTEKQQKSLKTISSLIETSVLKSFPHMPKGLFRTAWYKIHVRGSYYVINASFSGIRHVPSISIELPKDLKGQSAMTAEGQVSYLDLDSAKLVKEVTKLSKGFWSSVLDSSVPFIGLDFFDDAMAVSIYHQKDSLTVHGKPEFFKFEEIATSIY